MIAPLLSLTPRAAFIAREPEPDVPLSTRYGHDGELSGLAAFGKSRRPPKRPEWGAKLLSKENGRSGNDQSQERKTRKARTLGEYGPSMLRASNG